MPKSLVQLTAEIVQSQTSAKQMSTEEVKTALKDTFQALKSLQAAEVSSLVEADSSESAKVLDPKKSIQKNNSNSHFVPKRAILNGIEGFIGSIGGCLTHSCRAFSARRSPKSCFLGPLDSFRAQ